MKNISDAETRRLRRFCCIAAAVLLVLFAVCVFCMGTGRYLPIVVYVLLFAFVALMQHLIATELHEYWETGKRFYLRRVPIAVGILLLCIPIDRAGKLTPEYVLNLLPALYCLFTLLDLAAVFRKIPRE